MERCEPVYQVVVKHGGMKIKVQSDIEEGCTCMPIQSLPQILWPAWKQQQGIRCLVTRERFHSMQIAITADIDRPPRQSDTSVRAPAVTRQNAILIRYRKALTCH